MQKRACPARSSRAAVSLLFLATLGLAFTSGCAMKQHAKVPGITDNVDMNDIAVPLGFKRERSWSYDEFAGSEGAFRSWRGVYVGSTKPRDVVTWYLDQMPRDGWTHHSSGTAGSKRVLSYTKGSDEVALLTVFSEFNAEQDVWKTKIVAEIRPTSPDELGLEEVLPPGTLDNGDASRVRSGGDVEAVPATAPAGGLGRR